ncbi:MAG: copper homeostasis protein CutC [Prevotella sp.]|jgi:copper homeostasis protein|nr:copper homeostasis protein CutC [Prevotella sp.]MCI1246293.1 copper homeostasis protein CutC [Prevotella sp.]
MIDRNHFKFEVCANCVESCIAAQDGGADRVELCAGIPEGGTTPSYGEILVARKVLTHTLLHVIIRPRAGSFVYSPLEAERMMADIDISRKLGADGVVFGCLTSEGTIDKDLNARLVEHAKGMNITFHRAFDVCSDPQQAIEDIIQLGFNRILTSGQKSTAIQGVKELAAFQRQADHRIQIMAGCGVNESNIARIYSSTKITEYHFSARRKAVHDNKDGQVWTQQFGEFLTTTPDRVKSTIDALFNNL